MGFRDVKWGVFGWREPSPDESEGANETGKPSAYLRVRVLEELDLYMMAAVGPPQGLNPELAVHSSRLLYRR